VNRLITYATTNPGKVASLRRHLEGYGIDVLQEPLSIPEPRSDDVREIAEHKVRYAYGRLQRPVVVLDAGFYIDALNGFPRAFVNFALETIGLDGILKLVDGKPRACEFRECLAYMGGELETPRYFIGHVRGTIAPEKRGQKQPHLWSDLGLIYIPENHTRTLAELTGQEYREWSGNKSTPESASRQFGEWYDSNGR